MTIHNTEHSQTFNNLCILKFNLDIFQHQNGLRFPTNKKLNESPTKSTPQRKRDICFRKIIKESSCIKVQFYFINLEFVCQCHPPNIGERMKQRIIVIYVKVFLKKKKKITKSASPKIKKSKGASKFYLNRHDFHFRPGPDFDFILALRGKRRRGKPFETATATARGGERRGD